MTAKTEFVRRSLCTLALSAAMIPLAAQADASRFFPHLSDDPRCVDGPAPVYSAVEFDVANIEPPFEPIAVRAVMTQPVRWQWLSNGNGRRGPPRGCFMPVEDAPAVVILHDSGGKGTTAPFYTQALQQLFTTLAPEMFPGPDLDGTFYRPELPILNYAHAFGALKFLADAEGPIGPDGRVQQGAEIVAGQPYKVRVDPTAVGCLGFSWGGVVCNQAAVGPYAALFGGLSADPPFNPLNTYRFAAHVANYPVCWARNIPNPENPAQPLPGASFGSTQPTEVLPVFDVSLPAALTGAPLLVQVGSSDDYDNDNDSANPALRDGSLACLALRENLEPAERQLVTVRVIDGAEHGFDRAYSLPLTGADPFGQLGTELFSPAPPAVELVPELGAARKARGRTKRFFYKHLY